MGESVHPADSLLNQAFPLFDGQPGVQAFYEMRAQKRQIERPPHVLTFIPNDAFQPVVDDSIAHMTHGTTSSYQMVWSPTNSLCTHIGILGATGDGKSTLAKPIAMQAVAQGAICIVLDVKGTWKDVIDSPKTSSRVTVLNTKQLRIAIGQPPPGYAAEDWWPVVVEIFGASFGRLRAHHLLYDALRACAIDVSRNLHGSLSDLIRFAAGLTYGAKNRRTENASGLHESLLQMQREMGDVYNVHSSSMPEQMFSKPGHLYILQPQGESLEQQQFYMTFLLKWIYTYRKENAVVSSTQPMVVFFFEDGSNLLDAKMDQNSLSGTSPIASTADLSREFDIGLVVIGHSLTSQSKKISRNIKTWIVAGLKGEDLALAKNILGLTEDQSRALLRLGKGEAVGLFPDVNRHAVFFNYPKVEVSA